MDPLLARADDRLRIAFHILNQLQLMERWSVYGRPLLVGAVAYGLVVAPDIDIEIYCDEPRIEDGFGILCTCARDSHITRAAFANKLASSRQGLFWKLYYAYEGEQQWTIDMWALRNDRRSSGAARWVEPITQALTDETRRVILELKEYLFFGPERHCRSIHVYRAVLEAGVRTPEDFEAWLLENPGCAAEPEAV